MHEEHLFAAPLHTRGPVATWWRSWYRFLRLLERPLTWLALERGFGNLVVLRVVGRRSGRDRSLPLGLLRVDGRLYVGHPSGDTGWTLNLRAAGGAVIEGASLPATTVRSAVLAPGPERDTVVQATFRQHPFPGDLLYRLAAGHVAASGVFFRLEPNDLDGRTR